MMNKIFNFVIKHPIWVFVAIIGLAFLASNGAKNLLFKSDYRVFFGPEHPQLQAYESMQKIYSKSDNVYFLVVPKDGNVFSKEHLASIQELTKQSWQIPYSTRVDSITNFQHSYAEGDDLVVEDLVTDVQSLAAADLNRIKEIALNEPQLVNKAVSEQGHVSVVNVTVRLPGVNPITEVPEVAAFVRDLKAQYLANNPGTDVYLSGMVMMNTAFSESSMADSATLIPLMFLLVIVTIGVLLRTITGTIASVTVIIISIASTMGLAGWLGFYLTSPSSVAPIMILTLAVADCVHILSTMFYEMRQGAEKKAAIAKSLQLNLQPIFLTTVTTAIGFLCMNFSDSPPYRDLGNLVAMGIFLAFIFSMTIFPAMLSILPVRVSKDISDSQNNMHKLAGFIIAKKKVLLPVVSVITVVLALNVTNNEVNDDYVKYFDETVPFRTATDTMQENISGMSILEVSVDSGQSSGIYEPQYLKFVSDFSDWLRKQPETDHVSTITDTIKRVNRNMNGDDPSAYTLPTSRELAAQYVLMYELSLPYGLDLNSQINIDKSSTRLIVTFKNLTTSELIDVEQRIQAWSDANSNQYRMDIASPSLMFAHIGQSSVESLLISTTIALIVISIVLGLAMRSVRFGLISLLPNLAPVLVGFGIWGLMDGQMGVALAVVASMTLGIVVDDTVHFLSKYFHARRERGETPEQAIYYAFGNVGRSLWITTFVLVVGFAVLSISSFKTNADMGLLTAITLVVALIIDFLFLPPLLLAIDKSKSSKAKETDAQWDEQQGDLALKRKAS